MLRSEKLRIWRDLRCWDLRSYEYGATLRRMFAHTCMLFSFKSPQSFAPLAEVQVSTVLRAFGWDTCECTYLKLFERNVKSVFSHMSTIRECIYVWVYALQFTLASQPSSGTIWRPTGSDSKKNLDIPESMHLRSSTYQNLSSLYRITREKNMRRI